MWTVNVIETPKSATFHEGSILHLMDVVWQGFDRRCHRYLLVLLFMNVLFLLSNRLQCIKCDVLGKWTNSYHTCQHAQNFLGEIIMVGIPLWSYHIIGRKFTQFTWSKLWPGAIKRPGPPCIIVYTRLFTRYLSKCIAKSKDFGVKITDYCKNREK